MAGSGSEPAVALQASRGFVGREHELRELRAALDDAEAGRGRVVLIPGDPGIGKTRLADELTVDARKRGMAAFWGRCWEGGGAPAYWPWAQVLRAHVHKLDPTIFAARLGNSALHLAQILPEFRERLLDFAGHESAVGSLERDHARFDLFESVSALLKDVASERPALILLDDLHAADLPSLLLLRFFARDLHEARILLVGTYREGEVRHSPQVAELLTDVAREGRTLPLRGLSEPEAQRFIGEAADTDPPATFVKMLHQATGGNPFFLDEILRGLIAEGRFREGGRVDSAQIEIPDRVRDAIRKRLRLLSENCRSILSVASVIGREFGIGSLHQASKTAEEDLVGLLDEARRARILIDLTAHRYSFAHGLVRETLYEDLPALRRRELHLEVAEAIERLHPQDLEPQLADVVHHRFCALPHGDEDKAIEAAARAGKVAMVQLAYEEAVVHFERAIGAIALQSRPRDEQQCELLVELGEAQTRAGDRDKAKGAFKRAADRARELKAPQYLARAALGIAGREYADIGLVDNSLIALLDEAIDALGPADQPLRARLLARLAEELTSSLSPSAMERGAILSSKAAEIARRVHDPVALARAFLAKFFVLWGPDALEERLDVTAEMVIAAAEARDEHLAFMAHDRRLTTLLETDDVGEVGAEFAAMAQIAEHLREPTHRWTLGLIRACLGLRDGRFEEAQRASREALEFGRQVQKRDAEPIFMGQMLCLRRERGDLQESEPEIRSRIERPLAQPESLFWRAELALLHCELGRASVARGEFDQLAANDFRDFPRDFLWLATLAVLSRTCAHLGDGRRAVLLHELLLPYAKRFLSAGAAWLYGSAARYLGLLAATTRHFEEASRRFEEALVMNARIGARPLVAHTEHEYARMLLERGGPGDRERVVELLDDARRAARELGMERLLEALDTAPRVRAASVATSAVAVLRREGDFWTLAYEGRVVRLRNTKGLGYVARLLASPGREFHVLDLLAGGSQTPIVDTGDAGEVLDAQAKAEYRRRIEDLRDQLDEARANDDLGRAARAEEELDVLTAQLSSAVGLGGRDRRTGSAAERARVNVTRAVKTAIDRIIELSPDLGRHLSQSIRTGAFCSYEASPSIRWDLA